MGMGNADNGFDDQPDINGNWGPKVGSRKFFDGSRGDTVPNATADECIGVVKWYKAVLGYGFVELSPGDDAFLHANILNAAGFDTVETGTRMRILVGKSQKGKQVTSVVSIDRGPAMIRPAIGQRSESPAAFEKNLGPKGVLLTAEVKWFDPTKGFGFLVDAEGDIFIHASRLATSGLRDLFGGQRVEATVVPSPKGRMAIDVRLISD